MTGQEARCDEREALIRELRLKADVAKRTAKWGYADLMSRAADELALNHPEPEITEELVAAAYEAFVAGPTDAIESMRAALEAVLRVPVGAGEPQGDVSR